MVLYTYIIFGLMISISTLLTRSHKVMNALSILHAVGCLFMVGYVLSQNMLPAYYLDNNFFIDYLGIYEVFIAALIFFLAAVYSGGYVEGLLESGFLDRRNLTSFYLSFNILLIVTVMSFFSNNLALFWIFVELTTFFSAFLIAILNSKKNIDASLKYIFVTSTAMLFSFIGLILLFALTEKTLGKGTLNWNLLMENAKMFQPTLLTAAFAFIFIGYAAKAGLAPFHTTLPHAHSKAPSAFSAILSAVMLNIGLYGILRIYAIIRQTPAASTASNLLIAFGILSLFIAAFSMLQQRNLKKLIAFSSTEHMGLMLIGIGIGTPAAIFWALYYMLAHSLTKSLLFLSAGILHKQYLSNKIENIKNPLKLQPFASTGLIIGGAAIAGMPPSIIFISKFSLLAQIANASIGLLLLVLVFLVIAGSSFAIFLANIFSHAGEGDASNLKRYIPPSRMKIPIIILITAIIVLGVFLPRELSDVLESIVLGLRFGGG